MPSFITIGGTIGMKIIFPQIIITTSTIPLGITHLEMDIFLIIKRTKEVIMQNNIPFLEIRLLTMLTAMVILFIF